jgi:hypothetical protein
MIYQSICTEVSIYRYWRHISKISVRAARSGMSTTDSLPLAAAVVVRASGVPTRLIWVRNAGNCCISHCSIRLMTRTLHNNMNERYSDAIMHDYLHFRLQTELGRIRSMTAKSRLTNVSTAHWREHVRSLAARGSTCGLST